MRCRVACRQATSESPAVAVTAVSLDEPEDADGLENVAVSLDKLGEAEDGLAKVAVSLDEQEEAADGQDKVAISLDAQEEAAD